MKTKRPSTPKFFLPLVMTMMGLAAEARADRMYSIVDLGIMPGKRGSVATSINNKGQVVGVAYDTYVVRTGQPDYDSGAKSFIYSNGRSSEIQPVGGPARSINDAEQIVGGKYHSLDASGRYVDTDGIHHGDNHAPIAQYFGHSSINNGDMVGGVQIVTDWKGDEQWRAMVRYDGRMIDVAPIRHAVNHYVPALNDKGQALVVQRSADLRWHSYVFDLSKLTPEDLAPTEDRLWGTSNKAYSLSRYRSMPTGYLTELTPIVGNGDGVEARSMNQLGHVVGRGFFYDGATMHALKDLLPDTANWSDLDAYSINDLGQIVGQGRIDGAERAFLMSPVPVPEPGAWLLFLALAGGAARRGSTRRRV